MTGSKPVALPLGYSPKIKNGGEWIRTTEPEGVDLQSTAFSQTSLPLRNNQLLYDTESVEKVQEDF